MPDTQNTETSAHPPEPNGPETPAAAADPEVAAPAPEVQQEEKSEANNEQRLVNSALEASLSEVLPLSPIETAGKEPATARENAEKKHGRHGLRRGNVGRNNRRGGKAAEPSVGIVENPKEATESLSGKFVDGYDKDKEFRHAREKREAAVAARVEGAAPAAKGWCLTEPALAHSAPGATDATRDMATRRRYPQSNSGAANRPKLIIEPSPIPEQEKDPSLWQRLKAKLLALFGLKKKENSEKRRRGGNAGGNNRNGGGKSFPPRNGNFRNKGDRGNEKRGEFRGGNSRRRRGGRGRRGGNSGARPAAQNGGGASAAS